VEQVDAQRRGFPFESAPKYATWS